MTSAPGKNAITATLSRNRLAGLFAGPAAGIAAIAILQAITALSCDARFAAAGVSAWNTLRFAALCLTVLAGAMNAAGCLSACAHWRDARHRMVDATVLPARRRQECLYLCTAMLCAIVLLAVIAAGVPVWINPVCQDPYAR